MSFVDAISVSPAARDWLANSQYPRILHVFDRACNLINEKREVLSVVTPRIGDGPFNLVVEDQAFIFRNLGVDSPISICSTKLTLADLTINISGAKLWNPRPDWEKQHAKRDEIFNQLISFSVLDFQPSIPNSLTSNLSSALVNAEISVAKTITSKLAGLGVGLTPAGDDYILGGLLAVWIIHPPNVAKDIASEIANTIVPLTTSLSGAWLKSAGSGQAGILWHDFIDALVPANSKSTQYAMDKILATGETSGSDSMSGFINTFLCWQGMKSSQLQPHHDMANNKNYSQ